MLQPIPIDRAALAAGSIRLASGVWVLVDPGRPHVQRPLDVKDDARKAEAALLGRDELVGAPLDLGVDQRSRRRVRPGLADEDAPQRPELVRDTLRRELSPNPISLSKAIRDGKRTFEEAGGDRAYFGDPAAATADEGRRSVEALGQILAEAVRAELDKG